MPHPAPHVASRIVLVAAAFVTFAAAITSQIPKGLSDFDQSFYLTIAYDIDRYGVFSNGMFDKTDSTREAPPPGMFFVPGYPLLVVAAMKMDSRFAKAVECSVEANHNKRNVAECEVYATPIHIIQATWRMVEITGQNLDAFNPAVKLAYLLDHPLHFPAAVISALHEKDLGEFWRQVIGVLGLFDTVLQRWVYPTVSVLFFCTFLTRLPLATAARYQVATVATITVLVYIVVVYFVCYLAFTPLDESTVWGVQGRYFVPILSLVAIMVATVVNRGPDERLSAALAISAAVLSGCACIEAILRTDWI